MEAENILKFNLKTIAIIPNGIDQPMKDYLSNHNFTKKNKIIYLIILYLWVGYIKKRIIEFVKSVKFTLKKKNNWRLIIAGFPELNYDLEYIEKNNLNDNVKILEPLSGKVYLICIKMLTFLILPSFSERILD